MTQRRGGEVRQLGSLFAAYKDKFKAPQKTVIDTVIEVVADVVNLPLSASQCRYVVATRTLYISAPAVLKQQLMLHKEEVLMHTKARLGEKSAPVTIL